MRSGHISSHAHIVASDASAQMEREAQKLARTDECLLLTGETGTGKGYWARRIHDLSDRAAAPFIPINLAGLDEKLANAALFGTVRGAFNDAKDMKGAFEAAGNGTIFLDEIGDAPGEVQLKLLQVLGDGVCCRVGDASNPRTTTARVICATNRDLKSAVRAGKFREDLYYRINILSMKLPPLRVRREEVEPLAHRFFAEKLPKAPAQPIRALATLLAERFATYDWPGNVRDIKRAVAIAAVEMSVGVDPATAMDVAYQKLNEDRLDAGSDESLDLELDKVVARHIYTYAPGGSGLRDQIYPRIANRIANTIRREMTPPPRLAPATSAAWGHYLGIKTLADGKIKSQRLNMDDPVVAVLAILSKDESFPLPPELRAALHTPPPAKPAAL